MHGLGCWFDIAFQGTAATVVLSTSPGSPGTHWYQCRLLLPEPIAVNRGQVVSGSLAFKANEHFSYDLTLTARLEGTAIACTTVIRLQDQVRKGALPRSGIAVNWLSVPIPRIRMHAHRHTTTCPTRRRLWRPPRRPPPPGLRQPCHDRSSLKYNHCSDRCFLTI